MPEKGRKRGKILEKGERWANEFSTERVVCAEKKSCDSYAVGTTRKVINISCKTTYPN